jgi:hypothetical protein
MMGWNFELSIPGKGLMIRSFSSRTSFSGM